MREIAERLTHKHMKEQRDAENQVAIEAMLESFYDQDTPMVGSFWYDKERDELFGVVSVPAEDLKYYRSPQLGCEVKTSSRLHSTIWRREYHRKKDKRFQGDYTEVPRGRVFEFKDRGFVVFTGDWIDEYPHVKDMISEEFQLLGDSIEFRKDIHWDLGHGWSDEF